MFTLQSVFCVVLWSVLLRTFPSTEHNIVLWTNCAPLLLCEFVCSGQLYDEVTGRLNQNRERDSVNNIKRYNSTKNRCCLS